MTAVNTGDQTEYSSLRQLLFGICSSPVVFQGFIGDWAAKEWSLSYLAEVLAEEKIRCRIGLKDIRVVQWETECDYVDVTLYNFAAWLQGDTLPSNPLHGYEHDKYWCYIDYKYMRDVFSGKPEMLKAVQWESFGFEGRDGTDSTLWIGSSGAYTVGHYDTYGCNLVAQIKGRKRWVLFPPSQTENLYPTRVPYEESSVFSQINIGHPDLDSFPKVKWSTPFIVTLEPGQVLFVPRHWWHFVHCLEPSISINTWIELEADYLERVKEAITKTVVSSLMSSACADGELDEEDWLNPTQDITTHTENLGQLKSALTQWSSRENNICDVREITCAGPPGKASGQDSETKSCGKRKTDLESPLIAKCPKHDSWTEGLDQFGVIDFPSVLEGLSLKPGQSVIPVTASSFSQYLHIIGLPGGEGQGPAPSGSSNPAKRPGSHMLFSEEGSSRGDYSNLSTQRLVNCLAHPSVVSLVASLLTENME